jgi:hypothetical protein
MGLQKPMQGKISHHIPIVAEDSLVLAQEIFNVFQSACCVQKDWFMAKDDRHTVPMPIRKFFRVDFRTMMSIDDKSVHADFQ